MRGSNYGAYHRAFATGVQAGAPDVKQSIGCNPPLPYDRKPTKAEIERRKARIGDLSTDPDVQASAAREQRERRLRNLRSNKGGNTSRGRTQIMEKYSNDIQKGY